MQSHTLRQLSDTRPACPVPSVDPEESFSVYEVRNSWNRPGYLITVPQDREWKFLDALDLTRGMIRYRKVFETHDRSFALLMSAYQEF